MTDTGGSIPKYHPEGDEVLCRVSEGGWTVIGWLEPGSVGFTGKPQPPLTPEQHTELLRRLNDG